MRIWASLLGSLFFFNGVAFAQAPALGLRVPDGFEVTEFAGSNLANDIYTLTVDPRGRIVVAGRGYIRILVDDDGDGKADRGIDVADTPKDGAMGMLWEGHSLYVTGDGGLRRFRITDDKADGPSELLRFMKSGGEHTAHAIQRGPDGWLYVLCGNNTGIDKRYVSLPTAPIKEPIAGCVLRFPPAGGARDAEPGVRAVASEVVAHGFRNPYGMDFNLDGELFTFDSDNERCVSLPWYEPTRFYHVITGGHHGWLSPQRAQFWRMPPYFVDVVAPVCTLGRGSPTGVACYRHTQFPEEYRGGFFLADWTFGKIHFVKLERKGSSYTGTPTVFLESVGDNGFAPTGLVVHPKTGDLYVSIGGRGTRGGVYRVRHTKGFAAKPAPLSMRPQRLDWSKDVENQLQGKLKGTAADKLAALQDLLRFAEKFSVKYRTSAIKATWDERDRYVRQAVAALIRTLPAGAKDQLIADAKTGTQQLTLALATWAEKTPVLALEQVIERLADKKLTLDDKLAYVRIIQLIFGDIVSPKHKGTIWEGYSLHKDRFEQRNGIDALRAAISLERHFPTDQPDLDREITRTLATAFTGLIGTATMERLHKHVGAITSPIEQIHYLAVLACHGGGESASRSRRVADILLGLDEALKKQKLHRDLHWPLRVSELYAKLVKHDPRLNEVVLTHPSFGRPDHALLTQAPGFDRQRAAAIFLNKSKANPDFAWSPAVVELLGNLPAEDALPTLRKLWGQAGVDAAILPILARKPEREDRAKFLSGLSSPNMNTVRLSLEALSALPADAKTRPIETLSLIRALGQASDKQKELQKTIANRLDRLNGQRIGTNAKLWTKWFNATYPDLAAKLTNPDGIDVKAWEKRLAKLDWNSGKAEAGRAVFVKASCATCHSGSQSLGPDLTGVGTRFSRADLFTAILQPSRDVPARYQTTTVEARDGKIYQGIVIYDAVDSLILQTGATTTARLLGEQIASRHPSSLSLMPAGLIDRLSDAEIVHLYAYLKSLTK
jgi:putative heme-binding domain-containing protein